MTQFTFKSKILSGLLAVLLVTIFIGWRWQQSDKKFSEGQVSPFLPHHSEWDVSLTSKQEVSLRQIFKQPFHYLATGVQSFAFVSQDGKYVLKFFKTPFTEKRQRKLIQTLTAYHLAYKEFPEDTGLLFIHLTPTHHLQKTVMVIDPAGKQHLIDLDKAPFVVQEKADLIFDRFKKLVMKQDSQGLKRSVTAVLNLVQRRLDRGFTDDDKAVTHNYGFVGDRPIHFDIGRLHKGVREGEYDTFAKRLDTWLLEDAEK